MRVAYRNLVDNVVPVASSEIVGRPITNVQDQRLAVKWGSNTSTTHTVLIDLGAPYNINSIAILGHNIATATSVIVSANSVNTWPGATSQTIVHNTDIMLKFFTIETYRYWRFEFTGQASIEVGRLWLGEYLTIDPSSLLNFSVIKKRSDNVIHSKNRQKWASPGISWRQFKLSFPPTSEAMIQSISNMYDEIGNHSSLIFCNFDTIRNYSLVEPCYVSIDGEIGFKHTNVQKYEWDLSLEEEK